MWLPVIVQHPNNVDLVSVRNLLHGLQRCHRMVSWGQNWAPIWVVSGAKRQLTVPTADITEPIVAGAIITLAWLLPFI